MIIDCDECRVRGPACGDCVVTVVLGPVGGRSPVSLDAAEQRAIWALAESGLVPPLRLVPVRDGTTAALQDGAYDAEHGDGSARAG